MDEQSLQKWNRRQHRVIFLGPLLVLLSGVLLALQFGSGTFLDTARWSSTEARANEIDAAGKRQELAYLYTSEDDNYSPDPTTVQRISRWQRMLLINSVALRSLFHTLVIIYILFNIVMYVFEAGEDPVQLEIQYYSQPTSRPAHGTPPENKSKFYLFVMCMFTALVLSLAGRVTSSFAGTTTYLHIEDLLIIAIFVTFSYFDYVFEKNALTRAEECRLALNEASISTERKATLECLERRCRYRSEYFRNGRLFVEYPVIAGLAVLFSLSLIFPSIPRSDQSFTDAFVGGGIIMHLAASQIIFTIISQNYRVRRNKAAREFINQGFPEQARLMTH